MGSHSSASMVFPTWETNPVLLSGARAVGGFYHALLSGVLVQWLTDSAPSGRDLADALRTILADIGPVDSLPQ